MSQNIIVVLALAYLIKVGTEKYFKEQIKQYWLNLNNNDSDKLIDFLLTLQLSSFLGLLCLSYIIFQRKPKPSEPSATNNQSESEFLYQVMKKRRSVFPKDYLPELIDDSEIQNILECANFAPTHGKTEPWRFVVYKRANFQELFGFVINWYEKNWQKIYKTEQERDKEIQKIQNKFDELAKASHLITIGMKRQALKNKVMPEWEEIAAVATAVQNIYLQTSAKKLGGYWSSMTFAKDCRDSEEMLKFLGLDEKGDRYFGNFAIAKIDNFDSHIRIPGDVNLKVQYR